MIELFKQYQLNPSIELRNKIIEENLKLVYLVVQPFRQQHDFEDILQVGFLELVSCVERFNVELGYQFSSFAMPRIRGGIFHYIRDKSNTIKIPRQYSELLTKAKKLSHLRDKETAANLGVDLDKWLEAKRSLLPIKSLQSIVYEDSEITLEEAIDNGYELYDDILEQEKVELVKQMLNSLPDHYRRSLELTYLQELTNSNAAKVMGVSESSLQRYKKQAIKTLKQQ